MTPQAREWRERAERLGCKLYYASGANSISEVWGYSPDEDAFQIAKAQRRSWFVLNDAKTHSLMLHHCGCWRLRGATTRNWPKIISASRASVERWARENRPGNPILVCKTCLG